MLEVRVLAVILCLAAGLVSVIGAARAINAVAECCIEYIILVGR